MNCPYCDLIEKATNTLYADDKAVALLSPSPTVPAQMLLITKQHFAIMEDVPDAVISDLFVKANKLCMALFDSGIAQGTNILIQNGVASGQKVAHFGINILPRRENDNVNLTWKPKPLNEEALSTVELKLKEQTSKIIVNEREAPKPVVIDRKEEKITANNDDYMIKQLRRIP
jgi:histidine triad (HIT) family protein